MPTVAWWLARISSIRRARRSGVLPLAIRPSTIGLMRAATCAADRPRSLGRTTSPWLMAMPPTIWARYSPSAMRTRCSSSLAQRSAARHAFGIGGELADGFDIGGEPGKPVGRALLTLEQPRHRMTFHEHPLAHARHGIGQKGVGGGGGLAAELDQLVFGRGAGGGDRHGAPRRAIFRCPKTLRVQCTKEKWLGIRPVLPTGLHPLPYQNCYKINHFTLLSRIAANAARPGHWRDRTDFHALPFTLPSLPPL